MDAKILIADDDPEVVELLRFTLEAEHYNVIVASDGEEAWRLTKEQLPDLVILDINMPKMNGFEVCENIRNDGSTCLIPIIMLTSLVRPKDRITGIKLGADEYLTKPFEPFELVARVENLLKRTRQALAANPLTGLPGNISIENEIKSRLQNKNVFAVLYTDVDNFKAFNDKYGFERGDSVIRLTAVILRSVVAETGEKDDFVGHIGGEDFVVITSPTKVGPIAEKVIENFDRLIPGQYDEDVRQRGYIWAVGRDGKESKFPLMTISIGATIVEPGRFQHYSQVIERVKEMLKAAKTKEGSTLVVG